MKYPNVGTSLYQKHKSMNAMVPISEYKSSLTTKTILKVYNDIGFDYNSTDEHNPEMDDCMYEAYKVGCVVNKATKVRKIIHRSPIRIRTNKSPGRMSRHGSNERKKSSPVRNIETAQSGEVDKHKYGAGLTSEGGSPSNAESSSVNLGNQISSNATSTGSLMYGSVDLSTKTSS